VASAPRDDDAGGGEPGNADAAGHGETDGATDGAAGAGDTPDTGAGN